MLDILIDENNQDLHNIDIQKDILQPKNKIIINTYQKLINIEKYSLVVVLFHKF